MSLVSKKALDLEKQILKTFNFFPISERLKLTDYGYRVVKEYVRFIVIKLLVENEDEITLPPPLVDSIWLNHVLDTTRYDDFCNVLKKKIHYNPDTLEELSIEEKRKRYSNTVNWYIKFFNNSLDQEIWDDKFLNNQDQQSPLQNTQIQPIPSPQDIHQEKVQQHIEQESLEQQNNSEEQGLEQQQIVEQKEQCYPSMFDVNKEPDSLLDNNNNNNNNNNQPNILNSLASTQKIYN